MTRKMTINVAKAQSGNVLFPAWECFVSSVGINNSPKAHFLRSLLLLLVMLTVGVGNVWGQAVDYSGTYYIAYFGNNKYNPNNPANTNNHYWCPVDCSGTWKAWFDFYPDDDEGNDTKADTYKTTDTEMEFLTTYRFKNDANYDSREAVWVITKHETIANAYYIQHRASEKYLTLNGYMKGTSGTGQNRLRVHLQSTKGSDNKSVFTIKMSNSYFLICPYSLDGTQWVNVSTDATNDTKLNKDANSLIGTDSKGGVNGLNVGGTLGYYNSGDGDNNSKWYLEDYIKRPTIGFDNSDNNKIVITNETTSSSGTIYYTTNGDDPTLETSERTPFDATSVTIETFTNNTVIKAVAKVGNEYSNVVTFNAYMHIGSGHEYLMQTKDGGSFYMVPPITTEANVTTTNIPHEKMAWYLTDAGQTFGYQYYYIVNSNTTQFLYCSGAKAADNAFVMKAADATGIVSTRRRFMLVASEGGYNIIPEIFEYEATGMCMTKKNGNNATTYLNLSNGTDDYSRWTFVPKPSDPKTLFDNSFATTGTNYKTYKIQSNAATDKYLVPSETNLIASATGYSVWFLEDTGESDTWLSYYYLRNRTTGDYVYFDGTADGGENANEFLISTDITSGSEDKYKFIVVKAANATSYNIIPKILKDKVNQAQNSLSNTMKTLNSRGVDGTLWNLEGVTGFPVAPPVITYDVDEKTVISMSCVTPGATIKYSTDGADPTTSGSPYDSSDKPEYGNSAPMYIKAVAVVNDDVHSDVISFVRNPKVTFDPTYSLAWDGNAKEPPASSVTIGINTTIDESEYSLGYSNNVDVGTATVTISDNKVNNLFISGTTTFEITRRLIGDGAAAAPGFSITIAKSGENYPVTVKDGDTPLTLNTHYTVSKDDEKSNSDMYVAMVTGHGNYGGSAEVVYANVSFPTETSTTDGGSAAAYKAIIDSTTPAGLKAYIVTGVNLSEGIVETKEVDYIPEGVPILLLTDNDNPHDADFTTTLISGITSEKRDEDTEGNKLQRQETDGTTNVGWGEYYFFTKGEFVLTMGGKIMKAGKFFLENGEYVSGGTPTPAPAMLRIVRGSSTNTTRVDEIIDNSQLSTSGSQLSDEYYTLDGQKLSKKPTRKGIYIQNGKKLIVK